VKSYHGYKWFISFLDDHLDNSWISLLKKKSDAKIVAMVRTQFNQSIKEWMSDLGGEYTDREFENFLKAQSQRRRDSDTKKCSLHASKQWKD